MIILLVIIIALAVALARGGRLSSFANVPFRFIYLLFLPLIPQLIIFSPLAAYLPSGVPLSPLIYVASMMTGAAVVWLNRGLPGFRFLLVGLLSNLLVIAINGGYMPVFMPARTMAGLPPFVGVYNNVSEMTNATPLWFLGDIFPIPRGVPFANVFSLGDVLIALGGVLFIQGALVPPAQKVRASQDS